MAPWVLGNYYLLVSATVHGGLGLRVEPLTATWWLTRPLWYVVLVLATLALAVVVGRFETPAPPDERRLITAPPNRPRRSPEPSGPRVWKYAPDDAATDRPPGPGMDAGSGEVGRGAAAAVGQAGWPTNP